MSFVTVPELKAQLNINHDLGDALLSHQIDATVAHVASLIGAPLTEPFPAAIRQAVLMLAACQYETREAAQPGARPEPMSDTSTDRFAGRRKTRDKGEGIDILPADPLCMKHLVLRKADCVG